MPSNDSSENLSDVEMQLVKARLLGTTFERWADETNLVGLLGEAAEKLTKEELQIVVLAMDLLVEREPEKHAHLLSPDNKYRVLLNGM